MEDAEGEGAPSVPLKGPPSPDITEGVAGVAISPRESPLGASVGVGRGRGRGKGRGRGRGSAPGGKRSLKGKGRGSSQSPQDEGDEDVQVPISVDTVGAAVAAEGLSPSIKSEGIWGVASQSSPSGGIPGLDLPMSEEKEVQDVDIKPVAAIVAAITDENTTNPPSDDESKKIRRSSRIKSQDKGKRRREVVFSRPSSSGGESRSSSMSSLNLSLDEDDNHDDSNSNSNSNAGTPSYDSPLATHPFQGLSTSLAQVSVDDFHASAFSTLKPFKVKSRWRSSAEASTEIDGDKETDDKISLISDEEKPKLFIFEPPKDLIRKGGHLLFSKSDVELGDKLKKFTGIDDSIYKTERKVSKEIKGMVCDCEDNCDDGVENCLNRLLMVECGPRCPTGDRCTNKRFQRKLYANLEVFKTDKKGHGLRTLNPIQEGGFVIEYVGEVLDPYQFEKRANDYAKQGQEHFYFMALEADAIIDATVKGNCSRFINHSCEPNTETQKWTVNGELRIGFFAQRDLQPGEEIVFDYQFQRYGKKAQRCFCGTASCRGWIGGDDEELEDILDDQEEDFSGVERKEKVKRKPREKKQQQQRRNKKADSRRRILEDIALEEELKTLERSGLKNQKHTLSLSRLMVRAEKWEDRERILAILSNGDPACKRLFLDYRGLKLMYNWMVNLPLPSPGEGMEKQMIRNEDYHVLFLRVLSSLSIPNKTMLLDSKVLSLIQTWSSAPAETEEEEKVEKIEVPPVEKNETPPPVETPTSTPPPEETKIEASAVTVDPSPIPMEIETETEVKVEATVPEETVSEEKTSPLIIKQEEEEVRMDVDSAVETKIEEKIKKYITWSFVAMSKTLMSSWEGLKEVFRIPKKERVEQMKEHEREADKGSSPSENDWGDTTINITTSAYDRDGRGWSSSSYKRRVPSVLGSQGGVGDRSRLPRTSGKEFFLPHHPHLTKEERRILFARKVAEEEQRKEQDSMILMHQHRCAHLGLDPATTPMVDSSGHYYLDPTNIQWKEIVPDDPNLPTGIKRMLEAVQAQELKELQLQQEQALFVPEGALHLQLGSEPLSLVPTSYEFPPWPEGLPPPPPLPPATLPEGWRMAVDDEGRCYYFNARTRHTQWTPPTPEDSQAQIALLYSSSEEEDEEEEEGDEMVSGEEGKSGDDVSTGSEGETLSSSSETDEASSGSGVPPLVKSSTSSATPITSRHKKVFERAERRKKSGLVQERIISPRTEDDKSDITKDVVRARKLEVREEKRQKAKDSLIAKALLSKDSVSVTQGGDLSLSLTGDVQTEREPSDLIEGQSVIDTDIKGSQDLDEEETFEDEEEEKAAEQDSFPHEEEEEDTENAPFETELDIRIREISIGSPNSGGSSNVVIPGFGFEETAGSSAPSRSGHGHGYTQGNFRTRKEKDKLKKKMKQKDKKKKKEVPGLSSTSEKSKEAFRNQIANVVVLNLNPYRKPDAKNGRIVCTEDFKHLARKMTHAIYQKELKKAREGRPLEVTEGVKQKTKEYVKKFMGRFSGNYLPSPQQIQQPDLGGE